MLQTQFLALPSRVVSQKYFIKIFFYFLVTYLDMGISFQVYHPQDDVAS